jgi:hypothetical protein
VEPGSAAVLQASQTPPSNTHKIARGEKRFIVARGHQPVKF